jgi:hypothetical protein
MITSVPHNYFNKADSSKDCSLGNVLFVIASVIGIAKKNGYKFGFHPWPNQQYFVNPLPPLDATIFRPFIIPPNYQGYDIGFRGFIVPDNCTISGYLGSERYWHHCEKLVKHYLTMKYICEPFEDSIIMHYRNYNLEAWYRLDESYYRAALKKLPKKPIIVVTDNIDAARRAIKIKCEYISNPPIVDFYFLSHSKYIIMANSSMSFMAAYLSSAERVIAPHHWYAGSFWDCPTGDNYLKKWLLV